MKYLDSLTTLTPKIEYKIVPCLCNEVWGVSGVFCAVSCLCNEVWGVSGVIYVIVPCLCNEVWGMSQITLDIHQTSLDKHGTIA
jgi:hypothetical protein